MPASVFRARFDDLRRRFTVRTARSLIVSPIGRWRGASLLIPSLRAKRFVVERLNQAVLAQDVAIYNLRWE